MKKPIIAFATACALASSMALAACSSEGTQEPSQDAAEPAAATPAEEKAAESDYTVSIDALSQTTDYQGKPAVVVTYTWANNSDEATSAAVALMAKAFQNGVQLETAIVSGDIDNDGYMAEVKPGAGTTYQVAYLIEDQSDVTVEVSELISFDDTLLAEQVFTLA